MRLGLYSAIQWNRNFSSFTDIPIPLYFSIGKEICNAIYVKLCNVWIIQSKDSAKGHFQYLQSCVRLSLLFTPIRNGKLTGHKRAK